MNSSLKLLNTATLVIGALLLVALAALADDLESTACVVGLIFLVAANWWGVFARIRYRFGMPAVLVQVLVTLLVFAGLSILLLQNDHAVEAAIIAMAVGEIIIGVVLFGVFLASPKQVKKTVSPLSEQVQDATTHFEALDILKVFFQIFGGLLLLVLIWMFFHEVAHSLPILAIGGMDLFILCNGWAIYAFFRNRQGRQEELAQVIVAAVAQGLPLPMAVRSYLHDRPGNTGTAGFIDFCRGMLSLLSCVFLPLYAYVRLCVGWWSYDVLVEELADRLEAGASLSSALRRVPGVATRELRLASAIGEATGSLEPCLRSTDRERWTGAWLEIAPRFIYPLIVLAIVGVITGYLVVDIVPRFKRIFDEFGQMLPTSTRMLVDISMWVGDYWWLLELGKLLTIAALSVVIANQTARWHTPVLGRLYRWGVQAAILKALGRLLAAGRTVPQSLEFLREARDLPRIVQRRFGAAAAAVERGEALDESLERVGLLPGAMGPLVRASERVRTLPSTLGELGDYLSGKAFRLVRRISLVAGPLLVAAVGGVVAFVAIGMFVPLIHLLAGLSV